MVQVTVLMTVYNGMPHVVQAVQSILDQTLQNWRFVIVDDGSTDDTRRYLQGLDDDRVIVLCQPNQGTAAAANHGLLYCETPYVARMDADDISLPTRLAEQLAFLHAHPKVGLVGAQVAPLGEAGTGGSLNLPTRHEEIMEYLLTGKHGLAHSCIMMRTDLLKQIGGYWQYRLNDAWDAMLRMGEVSRLANINRVLHHYRVHEGSQNSKAMRQMRLSIAYACELARRRQSQLPAITAEEFIAVRDDQPWWRKALVTIDIHSRCQYRLALAELHGSHRTRGAARMAWAAVCAPRITAERIGRIVRSRGRPCDDPTADR